MRLSTGYPNQPASEGAPVLCRTTNEGRQLSKRSPFTYFWNSGMLICFPMIGVHAMYLAQCSGDEAANDAGALRPEIPNDCVPEFVRPRYQCVSGNFMPFVIQHDAIAALVGVPDCLSRIAVSRIAATDAFRVLQPAYPVSDFWIDGCVSAVIAPPCLASGKRNDEHHKRA